MKKIIIIFITVVNMIYAQVSMSDLKAVGNDQLDEIRAELEAAKLDVKEPLVKDIDAIPKIIALEKTVTAIDVMQYFGYEYFQRDIEFYDNFPTPSDYRLGPGDELNLSLWGEINTRETILINKDGLIYYKNVGFINLSNKTLKEAELILKDELSRIYATIKDLNNPTELRLSIGELKSINVYFSGHSNNPGINLIHPFSDIFSAIGQSGGLDLDGSLRNIQLIRDGKIISTIDFYSFFKNGKNSFFNIRIIDGDVIHIPTIQNRVKITGEVIKPGFYELIDDESIEDLIDHASGLTAMASSTILTETIIPIKERISDDNAKSSKSIKLADSNSVKLNNGDVVTVLTISDVSSKVEIFGRVKTPGKYPASSGSLRDILDIAGGFDDPVYRKTIREDEILILRQDSKQFYSKEIAVSYQDSDQFKLEQNDKIFVYENINYRNNFTYRVEGEVFKPGTYALPARSTTVGEALSIAGGMTALTTARNITVKQEFTDIDEDGNEFTTSESVNNVSLDFIIGINSVIIVSPFENVVRVEGNVYNPGLVAYDRGLTMSQAIVQAGGYKPYSMKKRAYVQKANGEIDKANLFRGRTKRLSPGDTVIVPLNPDPSDFDITTFVADLSTTLANIAAILLIVDNQTD